MFCFYLSSHVVYVVHILYYILELIILHLDFIYVNSIYRSLLLYLICLVRNDGIKMFNHFSSRSIKMRYAHTGPIAVMATSTIYTHQEHPRR